MVAERIEGGYSLAQRVIGLIHNGNFYFFKKSCRFVRKIMSVCGKNHVGLWEKSCRFVGKIMSVCGKILLVRKLHRKIPTHAPK